MSEEGEAEMMESDSESEQSESSKEEKILPKKRTLKDRLKEE